jgi:hypothetical protein
MFDKRNTVILPPINALSIQKLLPIQPFTPAALHLPNNYFCSVS